MDNTSYIAKVSYDVENLIYEGLPMKDIQIELRKNYSLPDNLQLIDGFLDKKFGSSGCAFLDTDTGEVIVEFYDFKCVKNMATVLTEFLIFSVFNCYYLQLNDTLSSQVLTTNRLKENT